MLPSVPVADPYRKRQFRRIHIQRRAGCNRRAEFGSVFLLGFSPVKVGEEITEYRLQGETALQSLGDISVSYSATKGSSGSTSSGVKIRKILMADANSDGVVNTVDSLCILQASSGR